MLLVVLVSLVQLGDDFAFFFSRSAHHVELGAHDFDRYFDLGLRVNGPDNAWKYSLSSHLGHLISPILHLLTTLRHKVPFGVDFLNLVSTPLDTVRKYVLVFLIVRIGQIPKHIVELLCVLFGFDGLLTSSKWLDFLAWVVFLVGEGVIVLLTLVFQQPELIHWLLPLFQRHVHLIRCSLSVSRRFLNLFCVFLVDNQGRGYSYSRLSALGCLRILNGLHHLLSLLLIPSQLFFFINQVTFFEHGWLIRLCIVLFLLLLLFLKDICRWRVMMFIKGLSFWRRGQTRALTSQRLFLLTKSPIILHSSLLSVSAGMLSTNMACWGSRSWSVSSRIVLLVLTVGTIPMTARLSLASFRVLFRMLLILRVSFGVSTIPLTRVLPLGIWFIPVFAACLIFVPIVIPVTWKRGSWEAASRGTSMSIIRFVHFAMASTLMVLSLLFTFVASVFSVVLDLTFFGIRSFHIFLTKWV